MNENGPVATACLRAHAYRVTSIDFNDSSDGGHSLSLVSGDEGGWCVWWSLITRRPLSIFRPHQKAIIKVKWVSPSRLLTYVNMITWLCVVEVLILNICR